MGLGLGEAQWTQGERATRERQRERRACIKIELAARDGAVAELALAQLLGELGRALGEVGMKARTEQLPKEERVADEHHRLGGGVLHLRVHGRRAPRTGSLLRLVRARPAVVP